MFLFASESWRLLPAFSLGAGLGLDKLFQLVEARLEFGQLPFQFRVFGLLCFEFLVQTLDRRRKAD